MMVLEGHLLVAIHAGDEILAGLDPLAHRSHVGHRLAAAAHIAPLAPQLAAVS